MVPFPQVEWVAVHLSWPVEQADCPIWESILLSGGMETLYVELLQAHAGEPPALTLP